MQRQQDPGSGGEAGRAIGKVREATIDEQGQNGQEIGPASTEDGSGAWFASGVYVWIE